jgi:hypothetical protein
MAVQSWGKSCYHRTGVFTDLNRLEVGEHLSSLRKQFFKPPALRSGDAVRPPPAVHDRPPLRRLNRSGLRGIFLQREVRARPMLISKIRFERASQRRFAEHDNLVETLPPARSDHSLRTRILPRRPRGRQDFPHTHRNFGMIAGSSAGEAETARCEHFRSYDAKGSPFSSAPRRRGGGTEAELNCSGAKREGR